MSENSIKNILDVTLEKLRASVNADTVIGTPIVVGETTIIPVSKVAFGLASGGSDIPNKHNQQSFGGGSSAGVSVTPVAFLAVNGDNVRVLPVALETTSFDRVIAAAPELIDKVKEVFTPKEKENTQE